MKKFFLLLLVTPCFASLHYASQTAKPTAKVAYYGVKVASYPVRHPVKTAKAAGHVVKEAVVTAF